MRGGVREWLNRAFSKNARPEKVSWVQIPPPPPIYNFSVFEGCCLALAPTAKIFCGNYHMYHYSTTFTYNATTAKM